MLEQPKRESLIQRVAGILEAAIRRGEWRGRLPGERALCVRLNVSRLTVARALHLLKQKQLVRAVPRVGYRIQPHHGPAGRAAAATAVHLLLRGDFEHLPAWGQLVYRDVARMLAGAGMELCFHNLARLQGGSTASRLARLVRREQAACWALHSASAAVQLWFMRHHLPTLVVGHCHAGVQLPSIDADNRAICRHAATQLLRLGHRHIVLLTPRQRLAGDRFSEQGFFEGLSGPASAGAHGENWRHDMTPESVRRLVREHWSTPDHPTGIVVSDANCAVTVAGALMQCGLRPGRDVSVICRDGGDVLAWATPSIACYLVRRDTYARRLARLLLRLAQTGRVAPPAFALPRLLPGGTLGPAPGLQNKPG